MGSKNHIKANRPIRGIGKLGYTEGSNVHSTVKRLVATHDDEKPSPSKTTKARCPYCNRSVNVKNGKFVPHGVNRYTPKNHIGYNVWGDIQVEVNCVGSKRHPDMREVISGQLKEYTSAVNGITVSVGDTVTVDLGGNINHPYKFTRKIASIFTSPLHKDPCVLFEEDGLLVWGWNSFASGKNYHNLASLLLAPYYLRPVEAV